MMTTVNMSWVILNLVMALVSVRKSYTLPITFLCVAIILLFKAYGLWGAVAGTMAYSLTVINCISYKFNYTRMIIGIASSVLMCMELTCVVLIYFNISTPIFWGMYIPVGMCMYLLILLACLRGRNERNFNRGLNNTRDARNLDTWQINDMGNKGNSE